MTEVKTKKRKNTKKIGSSFEREICKTLSLWWSSGASDSVFWRTASSGGRATQRGKQDQKTENSHGDVMSLTEKGNPLLQVVTLELKKGYPEHSVHDILDRGDGKPSPYEVWFNKADADARAAGSFYWALIHKKQRREALIWFPIDLYHELKFEGAFAEDVFPSIVMSYSTGIEILHVRGMLFSHFMKHCQPSHVLRLLEE